ncbi:unnamed protein product [Ilex paraguariensis]|uniref:Alpha/beta hydrolase fold-3 domain-containing protein n=1 Tax=Ilex paraguariensis TaxID=185542 RepID=A0ABC8UJN3_9AQUA
MTPSQHTPPHYSINTFTVYRLAPEHHLPAAYDDSWVAIKWVASHSGGDGQEPWLKDHVDFQRVFFSGDSAGGNIAHNMGMRVGSEKLDGISLVGLVLAHAFFWGEKPIGNESSEPILPRNLTRVLVCVAEKDLLKDRGWYYKEVLVKSGWKGKVEIMEAKGEEHVFHLFNPTCENAVAKLKKLASFFNQDKA